MEKVNYKHRLLIDQIGAYGIFRSLSKALSLSRTEAISIDGSAYFFYRCITFLMN